MQTPKTDGGFVERYTIMHTASMAIWTEGGGCSCGVARKRKRTGRERLPVRKGEVGFRV